MKRKLSAVEARKHLGEILEGVYYRGDEVVIERAGKPMAVVVPAYLYENILRSREDLFAKVDEAQEFNRGVPQEEIDAAIEEAIRYARREIKKKNKAAGA